VFKKPRPQKRWGVSISPQWRGKRVTLANDLETAWGGPALGGGAEHVKRKKARVNGPQTTGSEKKGEEQEN